MRTRSASCAASKCLAFTLTSIVPHLIHTSTPALTAIADLLRRQPQLLPSIEGHTDNIGSDSYNQDLSTRRAAAVKEALVRDFAVVPERLSSPGFGERRPVEPNETIAGRARNRRVELVRDCSGNR